MITIPFLGRVQRKIEDSAPLSDGLDLIDVWTDGLTIPDGVVPIIAGGAVRDAIFKNTLPHDIDIFFVSSSDVSTFNRNASALLLAENIRMWLEDQNIDWRSLSAAERADYETSGNVFIDIIEFSRNGFTYQVMLPESVPQMDTLIDRFPVMCKFALNNSGLYCTLPSYAAMLSEVPVGYNQRDYRYLTKKYDGELVTMFNDVHHLFNSLISRKMQQLELSIPTFFANRSVDYNSRDISDNRVPTISAMTRQLIRREFELDDSVELSNMAPILGGRYTSDRISLPVPTFGSASGSGAGGSADSFVRGGFESGSSMRARDLANAFGAGRASSDVSF